MNHHEHPSEPLEEAWATLSRFRAALYRTGLGRRKDTLCDLLDAVLTADGPATLAHLSLAPGFRRRWPSGPDALAAGELHLDVSRRLLVEQLPATMPPPWWTAAGPPVATPPRDARRPLWATARRGPGRRRRPHSRSTRSSGRSGPPWAFPALLLLWRCAYGDAPHAPRRHDPVGSGVPRRAAR